MMKTVMIVTTILGVLAGAVGLTAVWTLVVLMWALAVCLWVLARMLELATGTRSTERRAERMARVERARWQRLAVRNLTVIEAVHIHVSGDSAAHVVQEAPSVPSARPIASRWPPSQGATRAASQPPQRTSHGSSDSTDTPATSPTASSDRS